MQELRVDFLIIGAAKSATTSLYFYLAQHPRVFVASVKEPSFFAFPGQTPQFTDPLGAAFARRTITEVEEYAALFKSAPSQACCGEASVAYLHLPQSAGNIKRWCPHCKLVAILRDPLERAYSAYRFTSFRGAEPCLSFDKGILAELSGARDDWQPIFRYIEAGRYAAQLQPYQEFLDSGNLKLLFYQDLVESPSSFLLEVLSFLDLEPSQEIDMSRRWASAPSLRHPRLFRWMHPSDGWVPRLWRSMAPFWLRRISYRFRRRAALAGVVEGESSDTRLIDRVSTASGDHIRERLMPDIVALEQLTGRNLTSWRGSLLP